MKRRLPRRPSAPPGQESRPAEVERARRLIADPDYPPPRVTRALARLLAKHLTPGP